MEARPHWILPTGQIFTDSVLQWDKVWQFSESPDNKLSWHVTYDRRLTMVQVINQPGTGCVDVLEPKQQFLAGCHVEPIDAELCAEVQSPQAGRM
eukprot:8795956-Pyramimonas_sp.AAC.1